MFIPYEPLTEQQALEARYQLLPKGRYQGHIFMAEDKISRTSGNPMTEVVIHVKDKNGQKMEIKDFLTYVPGMQWKIRHCAQATQTLDHYENKRFCGEVIKGKDVIVEVDIQEGNLIPDEKLNGKPEGSKYPNKNIIVDYVVENNIKSSTLSPLGASPLPLNKPIPGNEFINDDLPF
jgi:hypothetical protein